MKIQDNEEYIKLINGHHDNLKSIVHTINFFKINKSHLEMTEKLEHIFQYTETNLEYFSFLTTSFLDLLCTLKGLLNSETEWEDIHHSKSGFLTIYETINTYHKHQKEIKLIVDIDHPDLLDDYKKLNIYLKQYKNKFNHKTEIATIRNKTAGHFDKNFNEYYQVIKKLDKAESIDAIDSFLGFLKLLMNFVNRMADKMKLKTEIDLAKSKEEYYKRQ